MINLPIEELKKKLVNSGLVREPDFDLAVKDAERAGKNFVDILISRRLIDPDYYTNLISEYFKVPRADAVAPHKIPQEVLHLLSEDIARRQRTVLFGKEPDGSFDVAMEDPNDLAGIEFLEKYLRAKVRPHIATEQFLNRAFAMYSEESTQNFVTAIEEAVKESERRKLQGNLAEAALDVPIVSIVDNLVAYSISMGASDIHIEALEDIVMVRFRIDGLMREILRIAPVIHAAIVARIKLLGGLRIDEHTKPQDGRFRYKAGGELMDIRVAIMPTFHGEKIVLRLLRATSKPLSFADLGMLENTSDAIKRGISKTYGIILITGPTGSGKTTTIYSMMDLLNKPEVNIVSVEDPVEYDMRYVNQTQVNAAAGITFAGALKAFLRQDPNIILVGEIRDAETADIAVNAALTGHLVVASLHTNDAPTAVPRLIDMSLPPFLVGAVVNMIIAQRLVRRVCPNCIETYKPADTVLENAQEQLNFLKSTDGIPTSFYRGRGCYQCGMVGYRGRMAIYEIAEVDGETRNLISSGNFTLDRMKELLRANHMKTMFEDGLHKVQQGMTTMEEVLRVIRE
jgi:type IV pilus assembly protein PilB